MKNKEVIHKDYIDVLTVISCVAVVFLHVNSVFWSFPTGIRWINSNIIECLFYFAVPVFFMISGSTLIDYKKRYDTKTFFIKRFHKTLIPFLAWSTITYFIAFLFNRLPENSNILISIINCSHMSIYWFFIPLFSIYLSMPVLASISDKIHVFVYMAVYSFLSYSILPFIQSFFHIYINNDIQNLTASGFLLFPILGFLIANTEIKKRYRMIIYTLGIFSFLLHIGMTIYLSKESINTTFKGYINFPSVFYAVSIFTYCRYQNWSWLKGNKVLFRLFNIIKKTSLGIYLIHGIFVYYLIPNFHIDMSPLWFRVFMPFVIIFICSFITVMLQRIPLLKRIVP